MDIKTELVFSFHNDILGAEMDSSWTHCYGQTMAVFWGEWFINIVRAKVQILQVQILHIVMVKLSPYCGWIIYQYCQAKSQNQKYESLVSLNFGRTKIKSATHTISFDTPMVSWVIPFEVEEFVYFTNDLYLF